MAPPGRRHLGPRALEQGSVPLTSLGLTSTGRARWGTKVPSGAGGSQKKKKAVIRKEPAETQEYVSYQDMELGDDKSLEYVGFVPSVGSDSAGWHEPPESSACV